MSNSRRRFLVAFLAAAGGFAAAYAVSRLVRRLRPVTISAYAGLFGAPPQRVHAGQPVSLTWAWQTASAGYCQDYVDAVHFRLRINGEEMDVDQAALAAAPATGTSVARWRLAPLFLPRGRYEVVLVTHLDRTVSDGYDADGDGQLDRFGPGEIVNPPVVIVVR